MSFLRHRHIENRALLYEKILHALVCDLIQYVSPHQSKQNDNKYTSVWNWRLLPNTRPFLLYVIFIYSIKLIRMCQNFLDSFFVVKRFLSGRLKQISIGFCRQPTVILTPAFLQVKEDTYSPKIYK